MPTTQTSRATAAFLLLNESDWDAYEEFLDTHPEVDYDVSAYVMEGAIGVRGDILERAARIADTFRRTCQALHAQMQHNTELRTKLLLPLASLPQAQKAACNTSFFLQLLRVDFFLEDSGSLKIIEVNSCGGGLADALRCREFLQKHYSFAPPPGFSTIDTETFLTALLQFAKRQRPTLRTLGFVPVENGCDDYFADFVRYANWLKTHTDITPVFLELTQGELSLRNEKECSLTIQHLSELDAIVCDWFEDLPCLERVVEQLTQHDVLVVPPRSDLLFENKSFLSFLQNLSRPHAIAEGDWQLLQDALLPSFPLADLDHHLDELRLWPGAVLKMDIDCASENVFLYDFAHITSQEVIELLQKKAQESKSTWTVQKLVHPPRVPLQGKLPEWIDIDYAKYKYDLMAYLFYTDGQPHTLFSSRQFSREKVDELTEEGKEDGLYAPVCVLPRF